MREFPLLIKPASADCNLRCGYCFYLDKGQLYPDTKRHRMSDEVLEHLIKTYMATEQSVYSFGWQGGEPSLMGVDFFRKVADLQKKYGQPGARIANGLQTNATLIDDNLAALFGKYRFLLGCSLDGPAGVHDQFRRSIEGGASHSKVLEGIELLKKYRVEFNTLILVSQSNIRKAKTIFQYMLRNGFYYQQYIPCVEFDESGDLMPFAIDGKEWGDFLCELFDEWYPARDSVSIRYFDSLLIKLLDDVVNDCTLGTDCCRYLVIEYNGDIYPCDFFVNESLKLGNVFDSDWEQVIDSKKYIEFGEQKVYWNKHCSTCDCVDLCNADCLKHRIYAGYSSDQLSFLCSGWKQFIHYARPGLKRFADQIRSLQKR